MGENPIPPSPWHNISETYPTTATSSPSAPASCATRTPSRNAIAKIATELGKGNITQEELDRARNPILNSMERAQRDNGYWTGLLKDSQAKPDRLAQQRESIPDVKAITVDEVNKLARDIFGKGDHLNLNILPDHPATEAPPAEKQADQIRKSPGRPSPRRLLHSRHCRKRR